jgi:CubicO group peptidase (beta-lactamase class C family)
VPGHGLANDVVGPVWTDGGLATTATELARFGDALYRARLVSAASVRRLVSFDRFGTGVGVDGEPFDGHHWLGNSGSYAGFESELWHDTARGVTIAVVTNRDEGKDADAATSDRIWAGVAEAYDELGQGGACG